MDKINSSKLYKGNAQLFIPANKGYEFVSDGELTVVNQDGMPIDLKGKSPGVISVIAAKGTNWMVHYQEPGHHPADEVPVEVPLGEPPSILERMQQMVREEVINRYGRYSEEVETLEEAMDFDINEDGVIGSPYEVHEDEFVEEIITSPPAEPPAQPDTVPEETQSTADPTTTQTTPTA
jgi:hypothetical protein